MPCPSEHDWENLWLCKHENLQAQVSIVTISKTHVEWRSLPYSFTVPYVSSRLWTHHFMPPSHHKGSLWLSSEIRLQLNPSRAETIASNWLGVQALCLSLVQLSFVILLHLLSTSDLHLTSVIKGVNAAVGIVARQPAQPKHRAADLTQPQWDSVIFSEVWKRWTLGLS